MIRLLRIIEWSLLVVLIVQVIGVLVAPLANLNSFSDDIKKAKKQGFFYEGSSEIQTYFGKKIKVNGVVYDDGKEELLVYITGTGKTPNKLPNHVQVQTDTGLLLNQRGSSSSNNSFRSEGDYLFSDVPKGIQIVRIFNEAFGESFSFTIPLTGGER
ncbi:hypothetical protein [Paenibacillus sp. RC67]|uniref:hypothetical protein n=1 Tax=Paenibacillus sp. RC67 TaxID=3039392 RepID=UPI0024AE6392|nr:hypothetical protein [Paenibacillus sp. RC67]